MSNKVVNIVATGDRGLMSRVVGVGWGWSCHFLFFLNFCVLKSCHCTDLVSQWGISKTSSSHNFNLLSCLHSWFIKKQESVILLLIYAESMKSQFQSGSRSGEYWSLSVIPTVSCLMFCIIPSGQSELSHPPFFLSLSDSLVSRAKLWICHSLPYKRIYNQLKRSWDGNITSQINLCLVSCCISPILSL